jgi:Kef-type K+ transport system membrane component KefB
MGLPLAASEVPDLLTDLFVVLLAAKLGDELFKRLGQPSIVGEILAGVLIGPTAIGLVEPSEVLEIFAELGVVFLLFWVGLETRLSDIRAVGRSAALVGVLGVALPLGGGLGIGAVLGEDAGTSVFLGAALVATSVGITSAVLIDLGVLGSRPGRTILGAAVIDDILAMIVLAVAVGIAGGEGSGAPQIGNEVTSILVVALLACTFVAFFALGGTTLLQRRPQLLHKPRFSESPLLPAVIVCLGLAAFASQIGLAAIIGAFLAGMMVAETKEQHPIEDEIAPLYAFFPPFFFAFIGLELELGELADGETIALLLLVTAVAAITKLIGAWLGARSMGRRDALFVGIGMVPRGEVGIIVAGIGQAAGVIDAQLFAVIVGMSVFTTLIVPPLLRALVSPADGAAAVES